jgi:hypothetical protein
MAFWEEADFIQSKERLFIFVVFFANGLAEHAVKWYQDKVRKSLSEHAELEKKLEKNVDYSIPAQQAEHDESDPICKMMGPEMDW